MKITRRQLSSLIKEALFAEAAEVSPEKKDAISRAIIDKLGDEGGAAGLPDLEAAAKADEDNLNIENNTSQKEIASEENENKKEK